MTGQPVRFRHAGVALVRASTDPGDVDVPAHLDLDDLAAVEQDGRVWLAKVRSRSEVREALRLASPDLAARVDQATGEGRVAGTGLRRAVRSTAGYLLRWQRRATPFGLFAGVTVATVGPAALRMGRGHRVVIRADADWLAGLVDRIEQHPRLRRRLSVVANNAGFVRDGRFIVAGRAAPGERTPGPLREVSVRYTRPVRETLAAAGTPIGFTMLADRLAARFPTATPEAIDTMLHSLVAQGILITSLRPPMTTVDPLAYVVTALHTADAVDLPEVAPLLTGLEEIHGLLERHHRDDELPEAATLRTAAAEKMTTLAPAAAQVLTADVALDADVAIPEPVLEEAARAASVLLRLSTRPFGSAAWLDYHARFLARYGQGALVPVRELVADSGLGYPGGYLDAPRARPAWRMLTDRDTALLAMIQQTALDRAEEIVLSDRDVEALTMGDHADVVAPERVELGVTLHATGPEAINRGEFELRVVAAPRACTSMAGRFAYLLDEADQARLASSYPSPDPDTRAGDGDTGGLAVQLSFPPRRVHNENVVRVGRLVPDVVSLAEHPDGPAIEVDDLAVTADAAHLYLVRRSIGRRLTPHIPHALDVTVQTPPLARFLAEVTQARSAVFGPFDFGAARTLPHLPRIRYRRTVLAPARWVLTTDDLPHHTTGQRWAETLAVWRRRWRIPDRIVACHQELRLPLDLSQPLDRSLLRARLQRAGRLELQEDPPTSGGGWLGVPAELLIPMTATTPPRRLPATAPAGHLEQPGHATVVHARLLGTPARFDDILTKHLPGLTHQLTDLGVVRWWVRRHRDLIHPEADQHLAVYLRLSSADQYGPVAAALASFAAGLAARGLPSELVLAPYAPHHGRYGQGAAWEAAERVFTTDTQAAVAQLAMAETAEVAAQALAAASMVRLAAAFASDQVAGLRNLLARLEHHSGPLDRNLRDLARRLSAAGALQVLPGGEPVVKAWQTRAIALDAYHQTLARQRDPAGVLRTLLHDHHMRAVGVDPDVEQTTCRLARAAAMYLLAIGETQ